MGGGAGRDGNDGEEFSAGGLGTLGVDTLRCWAISGDVIGVLGLRGVAPLLATVCRRLRRVLDGERELADDSGCCGLNTSFKDTLGEGEAVCHGDLGFPTGVDFSEVGGVGVSTGCCFCCCCCCCCCCC